jgi:hypothetical protein
MRTLNCKRMTGMMSLYVADDFSSATQREASLHLATCDACRRLAEEFSATSALLTQACPPPEFDAEFYTGIRSAVLSEITHERVSQSSLLGSFWGRLSGRRWVYATTLAIAFVAFGVVLQYHRATREAPPAFAFTPPVTGQPPTKETNSLPPQSPRKAHRATSPQREQRDMVYVARIPHDSPRQIVTTRKPNAARESASSPSGPAPASEISQIEIQTADPNIRIIWLAPRDSRKSEEIDHSQYQDENGDEE